MGAGSLDLPGDHHSLRTSRGCRYWCILPTMQRRHFTQNLAISPLLLGSLQKETPHLQLVKSAVVVTDVYRELAEFTWRPGRLLLAEPAGGDLFSVNWVFLDSVPEDPSPPQSLLTHAIWWSSYQSPVDILDLSAELGIPFEGQPDYVMFQRGVVGAAAHVAVTRRLNLPPCEDLVFLRGGYEPRELLGIPQLGLPNQVTTLSGTCHNAGKPIMHYQPEEFETPDPRSRRFSARR